MSFSHTVGVKLLMKMGWKPEQGVGPRLTKAEKKLRKKTQEYVQKVYGCQLPTNVESKKDAEESDESDLDINLDEITFAPDDYKSYVLELKQNTFGLGYKGMDRKNILSSNKPEFSKLTVNGKTIRGQVIFFVIEYYIRYICVIYFFNIFKLRPLESVFWKMMMMIFTFTMICQTTISLWDPLIKRKMLKSSTL